MASHHYPMMAHIFWPRPHHLHLPRKETVIPFFSCLNFLKIVPFLSSNQTGSRGKTISKVPKVGNRTPNSSILSCFTFCFFFAAYLQFLLLLWCISVTLTSRRSRRRRSPPTTRSVSLRVRSGPASRCRYTRSLFLPAVQSCKLLSSNKNSGEADDGSVISFRIFS